MKRTAILTFALVALAAGAASAGPRNILVMRAEGTADASTRTSIDSHVLRLAKNLDAKVEGGDITFTDAAAVVGCNVSEAACKDEVLATLGVDEIVATTATATANGTNVTVRRIAKGAAPKTAQTVLAAGRAPEARIDTDIGPIFGVTPSANAGATLGSALTDSAQPPLETSIETTTPEPAAPMDTSTAPINATPAVTAAPDNQIAPTPMDDGHRNRRLQKIGMAAGGAFVLLSFIMWSQASGAQDEIDGAPANTPADFRHLQELEGDADAYAGAGNLFFLTGVVVGGVSGYYYWRGRRAASTQQAVVAPAVFPHGAGLTLTFGGGR